MGVGDRHSKRPGAADKRKPAGAIQRSHVVDDRELDDPFSAWDDDDAGALQPGHAPQRAHGAVSSTASTRVERRSAAPLAAHDPSAPVDPVAMRDIVISRARTLDDPLTTRVLAEIARKDAMSDPRGRALLAQRAPTYGNAVKLPPRTSEDRTAVRASDTPPAEAPSPTSRVTRDAIATSRRRTGRRPPIARDEPFRKK